VEDDSIRERMLTEAVLIALMQFFPNEFEGRKREK
jgi:hypothetical protein